MTRRVAALAAGFLMSCASVAFADTCTNLAFAFAQAGNAMAQKDLAALGRCVNEQMKRNKEAEHAKAQARPKKTFTSGKKTRY